MTPELFPMVVLDYVRIVLVEDIIHEADYQNIDVSPAEHQMALDNIERTMRAVTAVWEDPLQRMQVMECYDAGMKPHDVARLYLDRAIYPNL